MKTSSRIDQYFMENNSKKIDPKIKFQILKEVLKIANTKLEEKVSADDLAKVLKDLNKL